ncbi:MAG TPA: hypothetical protein VK596_04320 [Edaphobacter sp.]|nr:hypothetical protein [Edaphobacter sp.]
MSEPTIRILGVYRPEIPVETYQEQWQITGDDEYTRQHFDRLVLIEAEVEGIDDSFSLSDFGQDDSSGDPRRMQVVYDEALLSADGESLIQRQINCVHGTGVLRFACYLHEYDPTRSLRWTYGEFAPPPVKPVPVRLAVLVPYNACS